MEEENVKNKSKKKIVVISVVVVLALILILPMIITMVVYSMNFGSRVTYVEDNMNLSFEDFDNLERESIEFKSNKGQILRGYVYHTKNMTEEPKALIVFAHGYLNIHENYLNQINYFVQNGYEVMGYDNTGTNLSDGDSLIGLGQSPIDLDYALRYVESSEKLNSLPLYLYGHSWGGYAVTSVLNYGHKVDKVVSKSGFNNSRDMLIEYGSRLYGDEIQILTPYLYVYEKAKFGDAIDKNGVKGINESKDAKVLLLHSEDDGTISLKNSLYIHQDEYINPERIQTILYKNKDHDVTQSDEAIKYHTERQLAYEKLKNEYGGESKIPKEGFEKYFTENDKWKACELDETVMKQILDFYND